MSFIQELFTSRNNGIASEDFVGKQGRIWWDPSSNRLYYSDGVTPGGIPIGAGSMPAYGVYATETYIATLGQTSFDLEYSPTGAVTGSINGATMSADSLIESGNTITYDASVNDGYELVEGDAVTFSYLYGSVGASSLNDLGDVRLSSPQNGSVLVYDGAANQWVAGSPSGATQHAIQNGTTFVRIRHADGSVDFTIAGFKDRVTVDAAGINLTDGTIRVNGNIAINGPTLKIENKNSTTVFDVCNVPSVVPYTQRIVTGTSLVELARLCWDSVSRFNPTPNTVQIAGDELYPWSWRPGVDGYYNITASATLVESTTDTNGFTLARHQFVATANQTSFTINTIPSGAVLVSVNGATLSAECCSVVGTNVIYDPTQNDDYIFLAGDMIAVESLAASGAPLVMTTESVITVAGDSVFALKAPPVGGVIVSLNGATLPTFMFRVDESTITYFPESNDGYVTRDDDVFTFAYITGAPTTKHLVGVTFIAADDQIAFMLPSEPVGDVIASVNGATLSPDAFRIQDRTAVYRQIANENYSLIGGDAVTFAYIRSSEPNSEWARLKIVVDGVDVTTGGKITWVGDQIDISATAILNLTSDDCVSISVEHNIDPSLDVELAVLSASMIRGI